MYRRIGPVTLSAVVVMLVVICLAVSNGSPGAGPRPAPTATEQVAPVVAIAAHPVAASRAANQALNELERVLPPTMYGGVGLVGLNELVVMETPQTPRSVLVPAIRKARAAGVTVSERPARHSLADLLRLVNQVFRQAPGSVTPHITGAGVDVLANRVQVYMERITPTDQRVMAFVFPGLVELTVMRRPQLFSASV